MPTTRSTSFAFSCPQECAIATHFAIVILPSGQSCVVKVQPSCLGSPSTHGHPPIVAAPGSTWLRMMLAYDAYCGVSPCSQVQSKTSRQDTILPSRKSSAWQAMFCISQQNTSSSCLSRLHQLYCTDEFAQRLETLKLKCSFDATMTVCCNNTVWAAHRQCTQVTGRRNAGHQLVADCNCKCLTMNVITPRGSLLHFRIQCVGDMYR